MVSFSIGGQRGNFLQGKLPDRFAADDHIDRSCREGVRTSLDSDLVEQIDATSSAVTGNIQCDAPVYGHSIITRLADSQTQDVKLWRIGDELETLL